jgi:GNAT superfamily N-acetyltransferase
VLRADSEARSRNGEATTSRDSMVDVARQARPVNPRDQLRVATMADVPSMQALIATSVRGLSAGFYTAAQIEAAITEVFGVDTQLIADGTYYVIDGASGPVAVGGWSVRRTLYGGDQLKGEEDPKLNPEMDPARIRAFFVHPAHARRGLARRVYNECARAANSAGFRGFELMATLPGEPLYAALGFLPVERIALPLAGGVELPLIRMARRIDNA